MDQTTAHPEAEVAAYDALGDGARRMIVLGSTGSIGVNTLAVAEHLNRVGRHRFEVVGLAAGRRGRLLAEQAERFGCISTALAQPDRRFRVEDGHRHHVGDGAAEALVRTTDADLVVAAIVGIAGLPATLAAVERGRDIALANKETLVAAGELVMPLARERGARLLPVDSEHSAVWQCLGKGSGIRDRGSGKASASPGSSHSSSVSDHGPDPRSPNPEPSIRRIVLTASGGPFRAASAETMANATPEEALKHPTWEMGPKGHR